MAFSSRKTRRRRQVPHSWTTVGALVASATFGPRAVAAEATRFNLAASPIIREVEQSISPWERPEDVRVGGGHYVPGPGRTVQVTTSVGF